MASSLGEIRKVEYRQLGKSGLRVSVPILGALSFGDPRYSEWMLPEERALPFLKAAYDRGINTLDTSNLYSNGASETIIGNFMKKYDIPRHKLIILTKCYWLTSDDPSHHTYMNQPELLQTSRYVNQGGLSRAAIFNQVEASLKRLQTDYIDLYQLHRFDYDTPQEETMEALNDLVRIGKEREMIKYCNFEGIGIIPYHVLNAGHLARPLLTLTSRKGLVESMIEPKTEADIAIVRRVEEVAIKKNWKMAQVALVWIGAKVTSPIIGLTSVERMEEAIVTGMTLTEDEIQYLEEPYQPKSVRFIN